MNMLCQYPILTKIGEKLVVFKLEILIKYTLLELVFTCKRKCCIKIFAIIIQKYCDLTKYIVRFVQDKKILTKCTLK